MSRNLVEVWVVGQGTENELVSFALNSDVSCFIDSEDVEENVAMMYGVDDKNILIIFDKQTTVHEKWYLNNDGSLKIDANKNKLDSIVKELI